MDSDEDWDPTRIKNAKRRLVLRTSDKKRRKKKNETKNARRRGNSLVRQSHNRSAHRSRNNDPAKREGILSRRNSLEYKMNSERLNTISRIIVRGTTIRRRG